MDRTAHKAFRDASWASPDEVREFVAAAVPFTRKDVEQLLVTLADPALDKDTPHHKNRCAAFRALMLAAPDPANFTPIATAMPTLDPLALRTVAGLMPRLNDSEAHVPLCVALGCGNAFGGHGTSVAVATGTRPAEAYAASTALVVIKIQGRGRSGGSGPCRTAA